MPNDALRRALADARLREVDVASRIGVDPKTVRRWIDGRLPLLRHRWALADLLRRDEGDLWPDAPRSPQRHGASGEVLATYPHRYAVSRDVWWNLFERAEAEIGILADSGPFLADDPGILQTLAAKTRAGVRVRILLPNPEDPSTAQHGADEPLTGKVHDARTRHGALASVPGAELRLHQTVLYTSMCRADDEMLVVPHLYGVSGDYAPVLHLRRATGAHMVTNYLDAFEQVWEDARPPRW